MDLQFDRDLHDLWAVCDDTCQGRSNILRIDPATGKFVIIFTFERPTGMPNINNEGFAIASATECVADRKPVYWADDSDTDTRSVRSGNIPCTVLSVVPPPAVPEFPTIALPAIIAGAGLAGWSVVHRRRLA